MTGGHFIIFCVAVFSLGSLYGCEGDRINLRDRDGRYLDTVTVHADPFSDEEYYYFDGRRETLAKWGTEDRNP